jgi:transcriptional regulator
VSPASVVEDAPKTVKDSRISNQILDLISGRDRLSVHAGERKVRPPPAPTTRLAGCPVPDPWSDFSPLDDDLTDIQHKRAANFASKLVTSSEQEFIPPPSSGRQPIASEFRLIHYYLLMTDIPLTALDRELKKGAAELLLLSVLEARPRHGYELNKLIETQSGGRLVFHLDSLYPLLYRLEERGWIKGTWVEKPDERRRRFYRLTPAGQRVLLQQRRTWDEFVEAVRLVTRGEHA